MAKQRKKGGRGGAREGAGRPREIAGGEGAETQIMVRVGALHVQELAALEREQGTTRAGAVRHLIEQSAARRARREGG